METPPMTKVRAIQRNIDSEVDDRSSDEMTTTSHEPGVADRISLQIDSQPTQHTKKLDSLAKICKPTNAERKRVKM
jgi:hypothetical protein